MSSTQHVLDALGQALWRLAGYGTALGLIAAGSAQAEPADDAILPYRPTVSNPAQLPVPGQLEAELGGLRARGSGMLRSSLPYTLKLGFNEEWGLLMGGEAVVRSRDDDSRVQGVGDTSLILKRAWLIDASTAFGVEAGVKLPTAKEGIGSGHADNSINTLFSRDIGTLHVDLNLNATRLGTVEPGSSRAQVGYAAAVSGELSDHWGITGEVSGTRRRNADSSSQLLAALTYSPTHRLTFDVGLAWAPRPSPATTQWFAGVVFPIARLW